MMKIGASVGLGVVVDTAGTALFGSILRKYRWDSFFFFFEGLLRPEPWKARAEGARADGARVYWLECAAVRVPELWECGRRVCCACPVSRGRGAEKWREASGRRGEAASASNIEAMSSSAHTMSMTTLHGRSRFPRNLKSQVMHSQF